MGVGLLLVVVVPASKEDDKAVWFIMMTAIRRSHTHGQNN